MAPRQAHELEGGAVVFCCGSCDDRYDGKVTDVLEIELLAANEIVTIAKFSDSSKLTKTDFDIYEFDECPYRRYPCTLVVNKLDIPHF